MKLSLIGTKVKTRKKTVLDTTKLAVVLFGGVFLGIMVIAIAKHDKVDEELNTNTTAEVEVPLPAGSLSENECIKYGADDCPSGCEVCIPDPTFKDQACHSETVCDQIQVYLEWLDMLKQSLVEE